MNLNLACDLELLEGCPEKIETFTAALKRIISPDSGLNVDTRWSYYTKLGSLLLKPHGWVMYPEQTLKFLGSEISWYDNFYTDRGATVWFEYFVEALCDKDEYTNEQMNEVMEWCMASGHNGFIYDW